MERRAGDGQERKADGEKTGHQVPQPAEEVAEGQNPVKTGQEEVRTRTSRRAGSRHDQGFSFASRPISPRSRSPLTPQPFLPAGMSGRKQILAKLALQVVPHAVRVKRVPATHRPDAVLGVGGGHGPTQDLDPEPLAPLLFPCLLRLLLVRLEGAQPTARSAALPARKPEPFNPRVSKLAQTVP